MSADANRLVNNLRHICVHLRIIYLSADYLMEEIA